MRFLSLFDSSRILCVFRDVIDISATNQCASQFLRCCNPPILSGHSCCLFVSAKIYNCEDFFIYVDISLTIKQLDRQFFLLAFFIFNTHTHPPFVHPPTWFWCSCIACTTYITCPNQTLQGVHRGSWPFLSGRSSLPLRQVGNLRKK